jgi:hypothetical protein
MKSFLKEIRAPAVVALLTVWLTAWYTNQPARTIITFEGLKSAASAPIPAWLVVLLATILAWTVLAAYRQLKERMLLSQELIKKEKEVVKPIVPQLHVAWDVTTTIWWVGSVNREPAMQILGWAYFSQSDATETIILNRAWIGGTEAQIPLLDLRVPARGVVRKQLMTCVTPVTGRQGEPLTVNVIIEDHKNRRYELDEHTFRFVGDPVEEPATPERNYWE